ncbi:MAG: NACHT domain-containing protein, partial [Verrucomicrobiota bacterium]
MALLETLATGVGAVIAKKLLGMWLEDQDIVAAAAGEMSSIVIKKIPNFLKSQEAKSRFSRIGDLSADSAHKMLRKEAADVPDDRLEIVANAAAETLDYVPITAKVLVRHSLSEEQLLNYFLEQSSATGANRGLAERGSDNKVYNDAEREAYRQILEHACEFIARLAPSLPDYRDDFDRELLTRFDKITDQVVEAMNRVIDAQAEGFEKRYRDKVVRELDKLELFGVDLEDAHKRYKLSVAYVSLQVERKVEGESGEAIPETRKVEEVLHGDAEKKRNLFLRGEPGSGKTTLLQWIAVNAASHGFKGEMADWNDYVPFFLRLRSYADQEKHPQLPRPSEFPFEVADSIRDEIPDDKWVAKLMNEGRALILIDGLDELPDARHDDVKAWVKEMIGDYPQARYILTARPYAKEEGWLAGQDFDDAMLRDMSTGSIDVFIDQWHEAILEQLTDETQRKRIPKLRDNLKAEFERRNDLHVLARKPLLCAMICAFHREKDGNLPDNRIKLYETCVEMLLDRDQQRKIERRDYFEHERKQLIPLLRSFAWWMIVEGLSEVDFDRGFDVLTTIGEDMGLSVAESVRISSRGEATSNDPKLSRVPLLGEEIARYFIERTGILREPREGVLDFPHRTLLEYLAANYASYKSQVAVLADNAHEPGWQEVVIMAAGMMNERAQSARLCRHDHALGRSTQGIP